MMNEAKAREISQADDLSNFSIEEIFQCDRYIMYQALVQLDKKLSGMSMEPVVAEYIKLMAVTHYGSVETDKFLQHLGCYPDWLNRGSSS